MPLPVPTDPHGVHFAFALEVHNRTMNGRHHEALAIADRIESVLLALNDGPGRLIARQGRMYALLGLGKFNEALAIGEELAAARHLTGPRVNYAKTLADLADLHIKLGRTDKGLHLLARAITELELVPRGGPRYFSAICSVGDAAKSAELFELADQCSRSAARLETTDPVFQESLRLMHAEMLLEWGMRLEQVGAVSEARARVSRSVELTRGYGTHDAPIAVALLALGLALTDQPRPAMTLVDGHLLELRAQGLNHEARLLHIAHGRALRTLGDLRGAHREMTAAIGLAENHSQRLIIRYELARLAAAMEPGVPTQTMMDTVREQVTHLWQQRLDRRQMLGQARRRAELETAREQAETVSISDALTGLGNRRAFDTRLGQVGRGSALILIDVDEFKGINDVFSHGVGDGVLRAVAEILRSHCRQGEAAVRFGGDEFAIFLNADLGTAARIAERIRTVVGRFDWNALMPGLRVTLSMGAAAYADGMTGQTMFDQADRRLYTAKRDGRDRLVAA